MVSSKILLEGERDEQDEEILKMKKKAKRIRAENRHVKCDSD